MEFEVRLNMKDVLGYGFDYDKSVLIKTGNMIGKYLSKMSGSELHRVAEMILLGSRNNGIVKTDEDVDRLYPAIERLDKSTVIVNPLVTLSDLLHRSSVDKNWKMYSKCEAFLRKQKQRLG